MWTNFIPSKFMDNNFLNLIIFILPMLYLSLKPNWVKAFPKLFAALWINDVICIVYCLLGLLLPINRNNINKLCDQLVPEIVWKASTSVRFHRICHG